MKIAQVLLSFYSIIVLTSCAYGMGMRRCDAPQLPDRPLVVQCIADENGNGVCFNQHTGQIERHSILNHVCMSADDNQSMEEWIKGLISQ